MNSSMIRFSCDIAVPPASSRTAIIIDDGETMWSTWLDQWEEACAVHDIDRPEDEDAGEPSGYTLACLKCQYLAESYPDAHEELLDLVSRSEDTDATRWNWA